MKEKLMERVKEIIKSISWINEDGGIKIYTDYRDRKLSTDALKKIFDSENPKDVFYEMLNEWAIDQSDFEFPELVKDIKNRLSKEEVAVWDENEDEIKEFIEENTYFYYDEEDFNNSIKVNLMVDCGNANYDYTCDNVLNWDAGSQAGEFCKTSSILWLAKTQKKASELRKEVRKSLKDDYVSGESRFVSSCIEELENLSSHMGTVTFLVKMTLKQLFELIKRQKSIYDEKAEYDPTLNPANDYILINKDTVCGLFDSWSGGGSCMGIELEKDVKLPVKFIKVCVEGCRTYGYDVDEVYGLTDNCWKDTVTM